jgi:hypothetical protein
VDSRTELAAEKVFFGSQSEPEYSLYLVSSDDDLRRVAIGMNSGRSSYTEPVAMVAFLESELLGLNITCAKTNGATQCEYANNIHFDITATNQQLLDLCRTAILAGRVAGNCTESNMKDVVRAATSEKCLVIVPGGPCSASNC